jgi:hypothetical protein
VAAPASLVIRILTDASSAQRGMRQAESSTSSAAGRMRSTLKTVGGAVAGAFAVDKVVDFAKKSITAASDLNETMSKSNAVFGSAAGAVQKWSKTSATSIGQSQQAALDAASTFGIFGKAAGMTGSDLSKFSTDLVGLSSDMASFSNTTPQEAVDALGSALRGESEPIRKYGVILNAAAIKAEAVSTGLVKAKGDTLGIAAANRTAEKAQKAYNEAIKKYGVGSQQAADAQLSMKIAQEKLGKAVKGTVPDLTDQQKIIATQSAVYRQLKSSGAVGDFAKTSGQLANTQRRLSAEMTNLQATLGQKLLPVVLKVTKVIIGLVTFVSQNQSWLIPMVAGILAVVAAVKIWTIVQAILNSVLLANPIFLIIAAIAALVAAIVVLWVKCAATRSRRSSTRLRVRRGRSLPRSPPRSGPSSTPSAPRPAGSPTRSAAS